MRGDVVGVCTLSESSFNADHVDVTPIAEEAGVPVCISPGINGEETLNSIRERDPKVMLCFGWSRLIRSVFPPFITGAISRAHQAAMATFCFGVMPPSAMFGRSLL